MTSRRILPLAGLTLGLLADPLLAKEPEPLELETTRISTEYESATDPVKGLSLIHI